MKKRGEKMKVKFEKDCSEEIIRAGINWFERWKDAQPGIALGMHNATHPDDYFIVNKDGKYRYVCQTQRTV